MSKVFLRIKGFMRSYPIVQGMTTYAVLWPVSNICQQTIQRRKEYDFKEALRFCIFGTVVVAPSLFVWVKIAGRLFPGTSLKMAVTKAVVEQFMYSPFAITLFYSGMTLLEGRSLDDAIKEVKAKFFPTWRMGMCIWPVVQTLNFAYVKERNRVSVLSVVSFFWTVFLSYMKQKECDNKIKAKIAS